MKFISERTKLDLWNLYANKARQGLFSFQNLFSNIVDVDEALTPYVCTQYTNTMS